MTLEELQEQVTDLTEKLTEVETERDKLLSDNKTLTEDIERVRTLNQKYFEKLSMQSLDTGKHKEDDEPDTPSCEEFAKSINI